MAGGKLRNCPRRTLAPGRNKLRAMRLPNLLKRPRQRPNLITVIIKMDKFNGYCYGVRNYREKIKQN